MHRDVKHIWNMKNMNCRALFTGVNQWYGNNFILASIHVLQPGSKHVINIVYFSFQKGSLGPTSHGLFMYKKSYTFLAVVCIKATTGGPWRCLEVVAFTPI